MKFTKSKIILSIAAVSLGGLGIWKLMTPTQALTVDPKDVSMVATGSIESRIDVVSKIALLDKETLVFKEVGKITNVYAKEGQQVKAWTVLATVDSASLDRDIASSKISLDNARISLKRLYEASGDTELLKARNTLEQSKRNLESSKLDLDTLGREKTKTMQDGQASLAESKKNLETMDKKLDSMRLDLEYTKRTEADTLAQTKADGDSRIKTTRNNAENLTKDVRDAKALFDKILLVDDPNNPILTQLGTTQLRSEANFQYLGVKEELVKLETSVSQFTPSTANISDANALAAQTESLAQKLIAFDSVMKSLIEKSTVGGLLSQSTLDGYRSSISGYDSKFSSALSSVNSNVRDLASGTSVSTIELSTKSSVASKEASFASSELDLLKLKNSIAKLENDLAKNELDYDAKIAMKKLEITSTQDSIKANQATYDDLLKGPESTEIQQAQNGIKSAELALAKLEATRQDYQLIAPIDGIISAIAIRKGQQSNTTDGITIENRDIVQLTSLVDQTQAVKIKTGMPVRVTFDSYRNKTFDAKVSFIESVPTETSGVVSYTVKFTLPKPEGIELYDAMTASARIITDQIENVTVIPLSALQDGRNGKFVQVFSSGGLRNQTIKIGKSDSEKVEVTEGLNPGQRIVVRPYANAAATANSGFNIGSIFGGQRARTGAGGGGGGNFGWAGGGQGGGAGQWGPARSGG